MQAHALRGHLWIVAAPSGAGKTSLVNRLCREIADVVVSVSHTTRAPRPGERHGVDYHFVSTPEFMALQQSGVFLESACVFDHHYGTSKEVVDSTLSDGKDVILEIDWQGARLVRQQLPCTSILILPPSLQTLQERLEGRNQDTPDVIARRLSKAQDEIAHCVDFDYVVINQDFEQAVFDLVSIVWSTRLKRERQWCRHRAAWLPDTGGVSGTNGI